MLYTVKILISAHALIVAFIFECFFVKSEYKVSEISMNKATYHCKTFISAVHMDASDTPIVGYTVEPLYRDRPRDFQKAVPIERWSLF